MAVGGHPKCEFHALYADHHGWLRGQLSDDRPPGASLRAWASGRARSCRDRLAQGPHHAAAWQRAQAVYATADPGHRINVPAARMTMDCADRSGLQNWLDRRRIPLSPGTCLASSEAFVQRGLVAQYATDNLAPHLASGRVRHLRALAARPAAGRFLIACDDGSELAADAVAVATSHPLPGIPAAFAGLADSPRLIADGGAADRLAEVARQARNLLVVGTGLTSADAIASLDRQGFAGSPPCRGAGCARAGHAFAMPNLRPISPATRPAARWRFCAASARWCGWTGSRACPGR